MNDVTFTQYDKTATMQFPTIRVLVTVMLVIAICHLSAVPAARAESTSSQAGMGILAFAATLLYTPAKTVYAMLGGLGGSIAYGLSGGDTVAACRVWTPAFRGTYVLTPDHLRGEIPIRFAGLPAQIEEGLQPKEDPRHDAEQP